MKKIFLSKTTWLVVTLCLLAGSIAGNYILFDAALNFYKQLQVARFHPLGLAVYPENDLPAPEPGIQRVLFYGDSGAAEWPFPDMGESAEFDFVNRAIGGQTSPQILLRYDDHVTPLAPDILLVKMCANELKTVPIFPEKRAEILDTCRQNTLDIIQRAAETDTHVILTTLWPVGEVPLARRPVWSDDVSQAILEINEFIRLQSADQVTVFDNHALLVGKDGLVNPVYARDELHLNSAGYERLNKELVDILGSFADN